MNMQNTDRPARFIHNEKRGDGVLVHQPQRFRRQHIACDGPWVLGHHLTGRACEQTSPARGFQCAAQIAIRDHTGEHAIRADDAKAAKAPRGHRQNRGFHRHIGRRQRQFRRAMHQIPYARQPRAQPVR